jgi:glycosyltransferase involved in cell wall biosynthesis
MMKGSKMAYRGTSEDLEPSRTLSDDADVTFPPISGASLVAARLKVQSATPANADAALPHDRPFVSASVAEPASPDDPMQARLAAALALIEQRDFAGAAELLDMSALDTQAPLNTKIEWAELLARANQPEQSDALFESLLASHGSSRRLRFIYARRLHPRGLLGRAVQLLRAGHAFPQGTAQRTYVDRLCHVHDMFEAQEGRSLAPDEDCRLLAMKYAILAFQDRPLQPMRTDRVGRISLITGGLGPGGAERQLSRTAIELERARLQAGGVGGVAIERPVEVLVRSHSAKGQRDFFLAELQAANVDVRQIDAMPVATTASLGITDPDLAGLIDYLPIKVNFGVRRLIEHFRETKPEVVSLWQDGACLFGCLAAIMAGVPRVQLVIRGLPPIIRRHMLLPEYEIMYRAMAQVPGVEFISNSKGAAKAYSEWLDIPLERFKIVYNGVPKMTCDSTPDAEAQWQEFLQRTEGGEEIIGGVFRFDTDKRPTWWIRFAYHYARRHPKARFVVVGDGRLFGECVQMAKDLKVDHRILFVGRSTNVGYWMKKMDALVLMSSFEGLPNVLIEAQYLGVPVVSTPAGGASECFIEGVTGHILGSADRTDFDEACEKTHALLGRAQCEDIFGPATRDFLVPNFSVPRMLENFLHATCGVN